MRLLLRCGNATGRVCRLFFALFPALLVIFFFCVDCLRKTRLSPFPSQDVEFFKRGCCQGSNGKKRDHSYKSERTGLNKQKIILLQKIKETSLASCLRPPLMTSQSYPASAGPGQTAQFRHVVRNIDYSTNYRTERLFSPESPTPAMTKIPSWKVLKIAVDPLRSPDVCAHVL